MLHVPEVDVNVYLMVDVLKLKESWPVSWYLHVGYILHVLL